MNALTDFKSQLLAKKTDIDDALKIHSKKLLRDTHKNFTPQSAVVVDAYDQVLGRGGKRIRGALTIVGYEMCGGTNKDMILQAACVIEMVHAYILVLDDIMDRSLLRRGGDAAHTILANYHKKNNLSGDSYHFGESVAINGALIGGHYAQSLVTGLDVPADYRLRALKLLNDALIVTGHGQINDIFNEVLDSTSDRAVDQVLEWKTAHYTFLNPLQFGMALAGVGNKTLESIRDFCMHAGSAFQITDDILGTFASQQEAGKSPMDDIREGKRTVLSVAALNHAVSADKNFLITMLGNDKLTQVEFTRCKEIFVDTGALSTARARSQSHVTSARGSLQKCKDNFSSSGIEFLDQLVTSLLGRTT